MDDQDDIAAIAAALGCEPVAAGALLSASRLIDLPHPTHLVHQSEPAPLSWLVLDGAVRCEVLSTDGRMTVAATHPPGDIIGAFGMGAVPMAGALVTVGKTRLLAIATDVIERLVRQSPDFALAVARAYARQAGTMTQRLASRISLTAAGRICARLLELAGPDNSIAPPPVVSALAVSVQTTRETTSRTISSLERRGIIARDDKRLIIQSPRMLEDMIV